MVDVSSSMSDNDLALTENAIQKIIDQYPEGTQFEIIQTYGEDSDGNYNHGLENSGWITDSSTITLNTHVSGTDFDQGLKAIVNDYNAAPAADNTAIYFFADGNTYDNNHASYETDLAEYLPTWNEFISSNNIEVHGIGINCSSLHDLDAISAASGIAPVYVKNIADLDDVVSNIASSGTEASATVSGNILDNITSNGTNSIDTITIDGTVYTSSTFPTAGITTAAGGVLVCDFTTGDYTYTSQSATVSSDIKEDFTVTANDGAGTFHVYVEIEAPKEVEDTTNGVYDYKSDFNDNFALHSGDGDDKITTASSIKTNASLNTEDGDDVISVSGEIKENASIDMGAGDDTLKTTGTIHDNATIDMGEGDDKITTDSSIGENASLNTQDGNDMILVKGEIRDTANINMGAGDDTLESIGKIYDKATLDMGDGKDTLTIENDIEGTATVTMGAGDDIINVVNIEGAAKVTTDDGDDILTLTGDIQVDAIVKTGAGDDTINVRNIEGKANVTTDAGDDVLNISGDIQGDAVVETGAGDDTINVRNIEDDSSIDMGEGEDTLSFSGSIDFDNIDNVEKIDVTGDGKQKIELSLDDVLDMTDDRNELIIVGDANDEVKLDVDTDKWTKTDTNDNDFTDGVTYSNGDDSITLTVDTIITEI